jgi:site-specific DNA recombinase
MQSKRTSQSGDRPQEVADLYLRVSTSSQEDNTSLQTQEDACRAYAAEHGYAVGAVHREVHSGTDLWQRPKLTDLRGAVRRGEVRVIIAHAIDRLSRDPVHLGVIISEAEHAGARVLFVTEPIDASPEGALIRFVRGYAAKIEHVKIQERTMRGKIARAREGRPLVGAYPPFGYQWRTTHQRQRLIKTTLCLDPERAPIVARLFEDAAAGRSLGAMSRDLTERGVPTVRGGRVWQTSTLHSILHNPIYTGTVAAFRHSEQAQHEPIVTEGAVPAIVSPALFAAAAARFARNKAQATRNNHDPAATLLRGGYARCGHCGTVMYAHKRTNRTGYLYRCSAYMYDRCTQHTIVAQPLDEAVWQRVSTVLRDPSLIAARLAELRQHDPTAADVAAVEARLSEVERKRGNLVNTIADTEDAFVRASLAEKLAALGEEAAQLAGERQALRDRQAAWQAIEASYGDLETWCATVANKLATADYETKRLALDYLGVRVKVYRPGSAERYVVEAVRVTPDGEIASEISVDSEHNIARLLRWSDADAA